MYIMYTYMLQEVNMAGKGSAPRPLPDYDKYSDNWDSIFKKETKDVEDMGESTGGESVKRQQDRRQSSPD
jgi:hypothetical protein